MLATGVPNLDLILGGGVPIGDVLLVTGPAGTGKTTLSLQMAFHAASQGRKVLYVSTVSEPITRLIRHIRPFAFYDETQIGKRLLILSVYSHIEQGLDQVSQALIRAVGEHGASLVVLDGLMALRDLHPGDAAFRGFVYDLTGTLTSHECTTVMTTTVAPATAGEPEFPEFTMVDAVIEMGKHDVGTQTARTIRANKVRGRMPLLGQHSLRIDERGLTVMPRIESLARPEDVGISPERLPWGLPELDEMMHGGTHAGSTTLLAGALGTGKTLACMHYLMEGARRGEKGLFVSFREAPRMLLDQARGFGLDLEGAVNAGQVLLFHRAPADLVAEEATWEMLEEINRFAPRRLALDSIDDVTPSIPDPNRRYGYLYALTAILRSQGITSLITHEIPQVIGPELDFSGTPLAVLAENLVLFRYVEFRGALHRIVSVIKMRHTEHDHSIRQYAINGRGIEVLGKIESAEGVLTGIARLAGARRSRRGASR